MNVQKFIGERLDEAVLRLTNNTKKKHTQKKNTK